METKKKQFFRTVAGKTILFIVINLALIITFLCTAAAAANISEDLYSRSEEQFYLEKTERSVNYSVTAYADMLMRSEPFYDSSLSLQIKDADGKILAASPDFADVSASAGKPGKYENTRLYTFDTYLIYSDDGKYLGIDHEYLNEGETVVNAFIESYADPDDFLNYSNLDKQIIHLVISVRYIIYPLALVCILTGLVAFIALMCTAGKRPGSEDVVLGPLGKIPFDILFVVALFVTIPLFMVGGAVPGMMEVLVYVFSFFIFANVMLGLCVSMAARVKLHMLIKGTLVYKAIRLLIKGFLSIPIVWKTVLAMFVLSFIEIIVIVGSRAEGEVMIIGWFLEKLIFCPFVFYIALMLKKLKASGEKLAKGNITYRTSTKGLWGDFRKHADNLNSVADSVTLAVDERLKSERMKTELITNVSHDIKTPLTSIINYASLIGTTDPSDPKMAEYSEVVVRQSDKLKRLIEDLVEASKASTGNLEIVPSPLDCVTFVSQTAGEFKEKLDSANLTLITNAPEGPVTIMADGRRMMRIYDNLMNNICKYAQPGTRVYLTLEVIKGQAVTTFKNTSSAELNISADELVERFVRGDQSRNTEGNGLGLSIAKSMTELQGGTFDISIDGDLFKVTLSFPVIV